MKKQAKKRPKPIPCECWCLMEKANRRIVVSWLSSDRLKPSIPAHLKRTYRMIRVRIVPVVAKAKNQKEESMVTKKKSESEIVRRWWGIYCLSTDRLVATHLGTKSVAQDIASENEYVEPLRSSGLPKRKKRKAGGGK